MNDIIIEVQDIDGNLVASTNDVVGAGDEVLNLDNLVSGDTYFIGVRNFDSAGGIGTFTLCTRFTSASTCDYGAGPYNLCGTYKADYVAADAYRFEFTSTTTFETFTKVQNGSTFLPLGTVPGLAWDDTYDVEISAIYYIENGQDGIDTIEVPTQSPCQIMISAHPLTALRLTDQCANGPRFLGSTVASEPFVCGAIDYKWTFERTDVPELPFDHYRGTSNRFLSLLSVPGLVPGGIYNVTTTPVFAGGEGNPGIVQCMSIVGPLMAFETENSDDHSFEINHKNLSEESSVEFAIYPNPCDGTMINLNLLDFPGEQVEMIVYDATGRVVFNQQFANTGQVNTIINFENTLNTGVYTVMIQSGNLNLTERLVVQN
jgi:hypothetical protein